jgi:hypothetical protein
MPPRDICNRSADIPEIGEGGGSPIPAGFSALACWIAADERLAKNPEGERMIERSERRERDSD